MKILNSPFRLILFVTFLTASLRCVNVSAQTTAFTYQGRLANLTDAVTGVYDFAFTLFSTGTGGSALAGPVTNAATLVTNCLFAATLDLGANFSGADRWLEIGVRAN